MPPTNIIDSDNQHGSTDHYFLEYDSLWKLSNPGGGNGEWTEVLNVANPPASSVADLNFVRVRVQGGRLVILGVSGSGEDRDLYILLSSNGGLTWAEPILVNNASIVVTPYTLMSGSVLMNADERAVVAITKPTPDALPYLMCERKGASNFEGGYEYRSGSGMPAGSYINQFYSGVASNPVNKVEVWRNNVLGGSLGNDFVNITLYEWATAEFGAQNMVHGDPGGWEPVFFTTGTPMDDAGTAIGFKIGRASCRERV